MPRIELPNNKAVEVDSSETLMQGLLKADIPVASSCQGDGICGLCVVDVVEGSENCSAWTVMEERHQTKKKLSKDPPNCRRLSCQIQALGDLKIKTTYW